MSVFVVVPSGCAPPTFFGNAVEALTEAQATGGDAYWRMWVNGGQGVRIELAAADAALQEVVVAAYAEPASTSGRPEEVDTSSVSVLGDDECTYCGADDCDRVCGIVAKRLCREWAQADFWPQTRSDGPASEAEEERTTDGQAAVGAAE